MNRVTINGVGIDIEDDRLAAHVRDAITELILAGDRFTIQNVRSLGGSRRRMTTIAGPDSVVLIDESEESAKVETNDEWSSAMIAWARETKEFRVFKEEETAGILEAIVELQAIKEGADDDDE